jgi:hypothetical protein
MFLDPYGPAMMAHNVHREILMNSLLYMTPSNVVVSIKNKEYYIYTS